VPATLRAANCNDRNSMAWGVHFRDIRGVADKSLDGPGRKQAAATKLGIYSTYSSINSMHFLASCSNLQTLKKNSEGCPSNQVYATTVTSASDEKWRPFNCFLSPGNRW